MEYESPVGTAASLYEQYATERSSYLREGQESSKYTLPYLIPETAAGSGSRRTKIKTNYQGIGAAGTNSLAAKLLTGLFPTNVPFFKLVLDKIKIAQEEAGAEAITEIDKALRKVENALMREIEVSTDRVAMFEALKHLVVGGNVLLYLTDDGLQVYPLEKYVCKRDATGNTIEIIIKETISAKALPPAFLENIKQKAEYTEKTLEEELDIYTHVKRDGDYFNYHQECKNEIIPNTEGRAKKDVSPFINLRFTRLSGESYGRGYVEEYRGDLISLEGLMKAIIENAAASARTVFLVNPNGTTRASTLAKAPNGAIREGNAQDISVMQVGKGQDLQVSFQAIQRIEQRLQYAFLMAKAVQRDAERVTSTELKILTQELESTLGGIYSILSSELQLPYLRRRMHLLVKSGKVPKLPDDIVGISIVTGLQGLGRGQDKEKLLEFITVMAQALGADVMRQYVNLDEAIKRLATSIGIETENLVKSGEEIAAEQQQMQQQELIRSLGSAAVGSPLLDPKKQAEAGLINQEVTANANQEGQI
jgi:hypothetical protein|tara:strand:- start:1026 stop:2633 length:1608 start_codon:yes stop_codon:yes gene_type:complete